MATTANHPDGSFVTPTEPDEDIAAIAKQISDHAEVIYQTWKSRGLAPNEILTCHNNINAADKFGSVLTSSFSSSNHNGTKSPNTPQEMNFANNLEHIVNKFVNEDKARLSMRQENDTPGVPSTAKSYPSSIQYALQKFEKRSPDIANNATTKYVSRSDNTNNLLSTNKSFKVKPKTHQFLPETSEKSHPEQFIPVSDAPQMIKPNNIENSYSNGNGASTWPLKAKSLSEVILDNSNSKENLDYCQKSSTLPSRMDRKSSTEEFLDEVAKEEERLINALKTGMVITANESKFTSRNSTNKNTVNKIQPKLINDLEQVQTENKIFDNEFTIKEKSKHNNVSNFEKMENLKKSEISGVDTVCGMSSKRNRRIGPSDIANTEVGNPNQRFSLRINSTNSNFNNQCGNPVRPFLTRGSVAERVMMFEKCPTEILEKRTKTNNTNAASWKNLASDVHMKIQNYSKEANNQRKGVYPPHTTLQRYTKANKNVFIPRFHYPNGKPISQHQQNIIFKNIEEAFRSLPNLHATKEQFSTVTKACGCPLYWKAALFIACGGEKLGFIEMNTFLEYWRDLTAVCHDDASRFMRIVTRTTKRSYIIPEDLIPLVQDVVNTHPGLTFLKQAPEFHSRYVHTVICRVYYCVNQSWNGQISLTELRKSDFLRAIQLLEEEEDINQITEYFSYEHFYVIYCKFWELDRDHDLFISKEDLARHSEHALSTRIIDRIFSRTRSKSRNPILQEGKMSYTDFVIFLLAEEDKRHPRAIEYWFRCMDLDGDGYLSMYELEYFYDEQLQRMEAMDIECLPFEDCLCQMLDMIQPRIPGKISLSDLKRCKMTPIFFDTFFNLEKYLDHEQRDPFASQRDHDNDISDWDRYAAEEYELLVAEESGNDHCEDKGQYRITENNEEEDIFSSNLDDILNRPREFINNNTFKKQNNMYLAENLLQPSMLVTDYCDKRCNGDSSDDYAGDSDDCSL